MASTEFDIDLNRITIREYRSLFDRSQPEGEEYRIIGKACGVDAEVIAGLGQVDFRRLAKRLFEKAAEPLADPN